jgi:hypothetical protein
VLAGHPQAPLAIGARFYPEVAAPPRQTSGSRQAAAIVVVSKQPGRTTLHLRSKEGGRDISVMVAASIADQ